MNLSKLTDKQLAAETQRVVKLEKASIYKVLLHLKEVFRRRMHLDFNKQSLHQYCVEILGYTSGEAHYRVSAVMLMMDSPVIEKTIEQGELSLTGAVIAHNFISGLEGKIDVREKEKIVQKVKGKSSVEAREILSPKTSRKRVGRVLDPRLKINEKIQQQVAELVQLTGQDELKLLEKLLGKEIKQVKEQRMKIANKAVRGAQKRSRYIPRRVVAQVRMRAEDQCEFLCRHNGERCGERGRLELHHVREFALGGEHSLQNLRLFCERHNRRQAIVSFGRERMNQYVY